jgi:hypothetical protein
MISRKMRNDSPIGLTLNRLSGGEIGWLGARREPGDGSASYRRESASCGVQNARRRKVLTDEKGCDAGRRCVGGVGSRACRISQGELLLVST